MLEYFLANAVTLVAYNESHISWEFSLVDISRVRRSFDGDYFFICRNEFPKVGLFSKIPFYVVFARSCAFPHPSDSVRRLGAEKYHFRGANVIGQTYHGTHVIGSKKAICNDDGAGNGIVEGFRARFFK